MSLNMSLRNEHRMSSVKRYGSGEKATFVKEMVKRGLKGDEHALEYLQVTDSYVTQIGLDTRMALNKNRLSRNV